ncbi:hypothetical protein [Rhizobium flavescens]|uniref:hypothetical protein n=1 Tax=Rhizobium flavescens TaxID=2607407 RepID=UPI001409FC84|nr:hypothetical protein [Rhizobium flavescens]
MGTLYRVNGIVAPQRGRAITDFYPRATVKAEGNISFRSQVTRDLACLLDVDPDIASWTSATPVDDEDLDEPPFDFIIRDRFGNTKVVDAPDRARRRDAFVAIRAAEKMGCGYRGYLANEVYSGFRLKNARDLLRYGNYEVGLNDRVRLLAALDEHTTLTVAECLGAFQEVKPMAGLASMILREFVQVELDDELIGPRTAVRRIAG